MVAASCYREFILKCRQWIKVQLLTVSFICTFVYTCCEYITCPIFWTPIIMSLCIIWNTNTWPSNFGFSRFISKIQGWFHTGSWVFWRTFVLCFASLIPFTYISTLTYGSIWKQRKYKIIKGRDLTQSYDKSPYTHRNINKICWSSSNWKNLLN